MSTGNFKARHSAKAAWNISHFFESGRQIHQKPVLVRVQRDTGIDKPTYSRVKVLEGLGEGQTFAMMFLGELQAVDDLRLRPKLTVMPWPRKDFQEFG